MSDPTSVNILLDEPTRGSNSGVWDTPVNANWSSIDGHLGGVASISLTNSNVTLSKPTGTTTPGAGPTQSENAVVKFTGTLTGNCVITFPLPGYYIVRNNCGSATSFYVQIRAAGTGNMIGAPPGRAVKFWNDGTDCDYCDPPEVASYLDLAVTTTPVWMNACSIKPYLICDGASYSTASYTALFAAVGTAFGGSGSSFNVPDLQGRYRIPLDNTGSRITAGGAGFAGNVLGTSGGAQAQTLAVGQLPSHTHVASVTDSGHTHTINNGTTVVRGTGSGAQIGGATGASIANLTAANATTGISISNASTGSGQAFTTIPPALVAGLSFIKT